MTFRSKRCHSDFLFTVGIRIHFRKLLYIVLVGWNKAHIFKKKKTSQDKKKTNWTPSKKLKLYSGIETCVVGSKEENWHRKITKTWKPTTGKKKKKTHTQNNNNKNPQKTNLKKKTEIKKTKQNIFRRKFSVDEKYLAFQISRI